MEPESTGSDNGAMSNWFAAPAQLMLNANEVHVWRIDITASAHAALHNQRATLSPDELVRAARFRFKPNRLAYEAAHIQLRLILARYTGTSAAALIFDPGPQGKPAVHGQHALQFSLSHSGEWALLAVCNEQPVGVDIEHMRALSDRVDVAELVFTATERVLAQDDADFFRLWTAKEAYVKAIGAGLSHNLQQVHVTATTHDSGTVLDEASQARWQIRWLRPAPGYVGALATPWSNTRLVLLH